MKYTNLNLIQLIIYQVDPSNLHFRLGIKNTEQMIECLQNSFY